MQDLVFDIKENGINEIIVDPNKGKSFIALKEVRWQEGGEFKLDLRRWYAQTKDGEETLVPGKGVTLGKEGGDTLAEVLVKNGYGDIDKLINALSSRKDTPLEILNGIADYCAEKHLEEGIFDPDGIFEQ